MADAPVVHIGENSPEQIAFKLMRLVALSEKQNLDGMNVNSSRDWLIRTFCMCLMAVKQPGYPDDALKAGAASPTQ